MKTVGMAIQIEKQCQRILLFADDQVIISSNDTGFQRI